MRKHLSDDLFKLDRVFESCKNYKFNQEEKMKRKIKIYGHSDDLIEIEGDIEEEFSHYYEGDDPYYLSISDGTLLSVIYDQDGIWRFTPIYRGHAYQSHAHSDEDDYSDSVYLEGDISWISFGDQSVTPKRIKDLDDNKKNSST